MTGHKHDILLVEDNQDDVALTLMALQEFVIDNPIMVVRNGAAALDYLFCERQYADRNKHDQPCLIILDLKLPKLNGIQVLERVKTDARTRAIPVVVLTSSREKRDVQQCFDVGANSYVVKPVEVEKFREVLAEIGTYWMYVNEKNL